MIVAVEHCPACGVALSEHPYCVVCRCYVHADLLCRGDKAVCKACDSALERRALRRCKACEAIKPLAAFKPQQRRCLACLAAWARDYYQRNKEAKLAYAREYHQANAARRYARWKAWYARNRDKRCAQRRAAYSHSDWRKYYEKVRDKRLERLRAWRSEHRDAVNEAARQGKLRKKLRVIRQIQGRDDA